MRECNSSKGGVYIKNLLIGAIIFSITLSFLSVFMRQDTKAAYEKPEKEMAMQIKEKETEPKESNTETGPEPEPEPEPEVPKEPDTETEPKESNTETEKRGIEISDAEYDYLCRIVMREAGNEPYDGQVLVAQCLYNAMEESGKNVWGVESSYGYTGSTSKDPNKSVKNAVKAVFYENYRYTDEKVLFYYAPKYCSSSWHETQRFVCQVGGHRFFAKW